MSIKPAVAFALAAQLAVPAVALARDVVMLDSTPSVEDLKDMLAPRRTRSIEIVAPVAPQAPATTKAAYGASEPEREPAPAPAPAPQRRQHKPVTIGIHIQFAYNSSSLSGSQPFLDQLGKVMQAEPGLAVVVEGHTDARGGDAYNLSLSQRRAAAVKGYLVKAWHVDPNRLAVEGKGKSEPLVADPFAAENRRVQFRAVEEEAG
jgi:outer membrane protein OmpA-like peptidoglycan-associated protein